MLAAGIAVALLLSVAALVLALVALGAARARRPGEPYDRLPALEEQVRGLLYRVWTLETGSTVGGGAPTDAAGPPPAAMPAPPVLEATLTPPLPSSPAPFEVAPPPSPPRPAAPSPPRLDLEQRIGARWATWVGIVAIVVAVALFMKWAFDNAYLGPVS